MLEQNDEEEYLLNFKKKIESNVNIPSHLKAVRIAETYISLGRHSQSLEYFEQALVTFLFFSYFLILFFNFSNKFIYINRMN